MFRELLLSLVSCYYLLLNGLGGYYGVCEIGGLYYVMFYNDKNYIFFYCGNFKIVLEVVCVYDWVVYKECGVEVKLNFLEDFGEKLKKMLILMWVGVLYEDELDVVSNMEDVLVEVGGIFEFGDVVRREKLVVCWDMVKLIKESSGDMEWWSVVFGGFVIIFYGNCLEYLVLSCLFFVGWDLGVCM